MKIFINPILFFFIILSPSFLLSQGSVGIGTTSPNPSSILDIQSTDKGILIPRMNSTQRNSISSLPPGLIVYDTDIKSILFYDGVQWIGLRDFMIDIDSDSKISIGNGIDTDQLRVTLKNFDHMVLSTNPDQVVTLEIKNKYPNLFIGELAGQKTMPDTATFSLIGRDNTFIGYQAGSSNEKGYQNTFIGKDAGRDLINGRENTYLGADAGRVDTSGMNNTFVGSVAGWNNKSGKSNTFIGRASGIGNLTGSANLFVGVDAGWSNLSGNRNTYLGSGSGLLNVSDSLNIFIGNGSGFTTGKSNILAIDNGNSSSPLIYGDFANDTVKIYGSLSVGDQYSFPLTDGSAEQILKTDGNGNLSWNSANVVSELNCLTDAKTDYFNDSNLFLGLGSGDSIQAGGEGNTAIGMEALRFNTTGSKNTALGTDALNINTTGTWNVAIGNNALDDNTTGSSNTSVGTWSLQQNSTGHSNTAMGSQAMNYSSSASFNTAIGKFSLFNIGGHYNVGLGYNTDRFNENGSNNTIIGTGAGSGTSFFTRSGAVYLGYEAGKMDTTDNKLYIENSDSSTPLIWGDFANDTVKIYGSLAIGDQYSFPVSDGSFDQILKTDGNGNLSWDSIILATSLNSLTDAKTSISNLFIGQGAGNSIQSGGSSNTAVGIEALYSNTTGYSNVAVGIDALRANIGGHVNTAVGAGALKDNTTGFANTVMGSQAMGFSTTAQSNTAIGQIALLVNNGNSNVALGAYSDRWNTNGNNNTIIGTEAGSGTSGFSRTGAVYLGYKAGKQDTTDNKLYIENSDSSTPLIWGDFSTDSLNFNGKVRINCTTSAYDFVNTEYSNEPILRSTSTNYGYLGSPDHTLFKTYSNFFYAGDVSNYLTYSDRRIKENIVDLRSPIDKFMALKPVKYDIKKSHYLKGRTLSEKEEETRKSQMGFIAQEVEALYPGLVKTDKKSGLKSMSYQGIVPILVDVVQKQEKQIQDLTQKVEQLIELLEGNK